MRGLPKIVMNTPSDPARSCAIANVGIEGIAPGDLAKVLLDKYKVCTVAIDGAGVHGVRVTPQVYTSTAELDAFVKGAGVALLAWVLVAGFAPAAHAQITGWVAGTVRDSSGAVLPGATVTLRGLSLQRESVSTVTTAEGMRIPLVPPGVYEVTAELSSLRLGSAPEWMSHSTSRRRSTSPCRWRACPESVNVSAEVPLVEVSRSDVTNRVTGRTIDALPLNGRNFTDLIGLVPGAKPIRRPAPAPTCRCSASVPARSRSWWTGRRTTIQSTAGRCCVSPRTRSREFEVVTTGYEAEFGRAQGGVANIITRSGTNNIDGRAFWFDRNDKFDSNNIPAPSPHRAAIPNQKPPKLDRKQWGHAQRLDCEGPGVLLRLLREAERAARRQH